MTSFVWTRMQAEGGQRLHKILELKEAERQAGNGLFWWGVGNSLGVALGEHARAAGGTLPVIFSEMTSAADKRDRSPEQVFHWRAWCDAEGKEHDIPAHVLEWSRGAEGKESHYALVCYSEAPLVSGLQLFDAKACRNYLGNAPGPRQVTQLLASGLDADHSDGSYERGFRATLVSPWMVKMVSPREMTSAERERQRAWTPGADWPTFVASFREQR